MERQHLKEKLQRVFMSWNYWDLLRRSSAGGGVHDELRHLSLTYSSVQDYVAHFEPLVEEECGALLLRGNEEGIISLPHTAAVSHVKQEGDFTVVRLTFSAGVAATFRDNDAILLSKDDPHAEEGSEQLHALGQVTAKEAAASVGTRFCLTDASQAGKPDEVKRVQAMRRALAPDSVWHVLRLCSLSTVFREYIAVHALGRVPFAAALLYAASPPQEQQQSLVIPQSVQQAMQSEYNTSQMAAVTAGLDRSPVILIQGPPGTGKTRTILGLLSIVLHAAPAHTAGLALRDEAQPMPEYSRADLLRLWAKASPWLAGAADPRDEVSPRDAEPEDETFGLLATAPVIRVGAALGPKAHVLVCAPSNSALDEIVARLLHFGLLDWHGKKYIPSVVRVGLSVHHSVQSVSLDALVEQRMRSAKGGDTSTRARERLKRAILEEAHIVCCTLSFSGSSQFQDMTRGFDVVVIDEAAQAVEPSILIPLQKGCKQMYLVGDPVQLPATVISERATSAGYERSLFKRLQESGFPVQMLDTQYRMHPSIAAFPSKEFYGSGLRNGDGVEAATTRAWHQHACLGPLALFHVEGKEKIKEGATSIINETEAEFVLYLYMELTQRYSHLKTSNQIAVISPYSAQVNLLKDRFAKVLGDDSRHLVDVNTIDGFQGREKEVVIFSAVRSAARRRARIGFVADERRINVALTRARSSLLLVGNLRVLRGDAHWAALIRHAIDEGCLYNPHRPFKSFLDHVLDGRLGPETRRQVAAFVPQAEPGVDDDPELYSDDDTGADMEVDMDMPPQETGPSAASQAQQAPASTAEASGVGPGVSCSAREDVPEQQEEPQQEEQQQEEQQQEEAQQPPEEPVAIAAAEAEPADAKPAPRPSMRKRRGTMRLLQER